MESTIANALLLLVIGMVTVFIILSLVVATGSILIRLVNRYAPDPPQKPVRNEPSQSNEVIAAIAAVVETVTQGQGRVEHIQKM